MKTLRAVAIGSVLFALVAIGCDDSSGPPTHPANPAQTKTDDSGDAALPPIKVTGITTGCSLYLPKFDEAVDGAETCGDPHEDTVANASRALYLARSMRSDILEVTPFFALGATLLDSVLIDAIVGNALSTIGLGTWTNRFDYTFDPATGTYTVAAKSGLTFGNTSIGTWDATRETGTITFRVYWGAGPRQGQPILTDVLAPASYLVDPKLSVSTSTGKVSVSFKSAGPLVSILGWGDAPTSPVVVQATDATHARDNAQALLADAHAAVSLGQPDCAYTNLQLGSATRTLAEWSVATEALDFIAGGSERKAEIPEQITLTSFAKMGIAGDWIEGPAHFTSTRDGLQGDMVIKPHGVLADMTVACH
jgi:hypothetical protein